MTDARAERQLEAVELILAAAGQSPGMADEATREALEFARPLLETAPAPSAFVEQLAQQIAPDRRRPDPPRPRAGALRGRADPARPARLTPGGRSRPRLTAPRAPLKLTPGARSRCQTR